MIQNRRIKGRVKNKFKFFSILLSGFSLGTIDTLEDIYNLYKGVYKYELENDAYRQNINSLLRQFLVFLFEEENLELYDEKLIVDWKNKINGLIMKNEKLSPFAELPASDRSILNDILAFLEKGDNSSVKRKLEEISNSIHIRKEQLSILEKQNKWSVPLAVVGLILTIIFGIWSIFL